MRPVLDPRVNWVDDGVQTGPNELIGVLDRLLAADVPRVVNALDSLRFASPGTMLALDDASAVFPWRDR